MTAFDPASDLAFTLELNGPSTQELATGTRLWIGRAAALRPDRPARWFLHGYFA
jgi:hypothetical protein